MWYDPLMSPAEVRSCDPKSTARTAQTDMVCFPLAANANLKEPCEQLGQKGLL